VLTSIGSAVSFDAVRDGFVEPIGQKAGPETPNPATG
jgi:hypothetical protein